MQKIIVIRGALGVGKSTVAGIVSDKMNAVYLSLNKIIDDNYLDTDNGIPLENFIKSNEIVLDLMNKNDNQLFILDGCFYYQQQVEDLMKRFDGNIIFISLKSSLQKCIERDSQREKVYGVDSASFVYSMTEKVKVGCELDNTNLSVEETVKIVLEYIKKNL